MLTRNRMKTILVGYWVEGRSGNEDKSFILARNFPLRVAADVVLCRPDSTVLHVIVT